MQSGVVYLFIYVFILAKWRCGFSGDTQQRNTAAFTVSTNSCPAAEQKVAGAASATDQRLLN